MNKIYLNTVPQNDKIIVKKGGTDSTAAALQNKTVKVNQEGVVVVEPDEGYTGLKKAVVDVDIKYQRKNIQLTSKDAVTIEADGEYRAMETVRIIPVLQEKTHIFPLEDAVDVIIDADENYSGLSRVTILFRKPIERSNYLTMEALEDDFVVSFSREGLEYCVDESGYWQPLSAYTPTTPIQKGQILSFKGNMIPGDTNGTFGIGSFSIQNKCNLTGNIMSLLYGDDATTTSEFNNEYPFYSLFYYCVGIIDASQLLLPAKTGVSSCYSHMFKWCTNLILPPELPATTLGYYNSYRSMFEGCTSLTKAPDLPALSLNQSCYQDMFKNCTSLTKAPDLPAITYASQYSMQSMFEGCTNLSYVKALFTFTPNSYYSQNWLKNVSPTGTFVKNAAATWDVVGPNGVPTGWTIETATE